MLDHSTVPAQNATLGLASALSLSSATKAVRTVAPIGRPACFFAGFPAEVLSPLFLFVAPSEDDVGVAVEFALVLVGLRGDLRSAQPLLAEPSSGSRQERKSNVVVVRVVWGALASSQVGSKRQFWVKYMNKSNELDLRTHQCYRLRGLR